MTRIALFIVFVAFGSLADAGLQAPSRLPTASLAFRVEIGPDLFVAVAEDPAPRDFHPRIVGGDDTTLTEYPWQVRLELTGYVCGGTLVTPTFVITAAHCVYGSYGPGFAAPSNSFAFAGGDGRLNGFQEKIAVKSYAWFTNGSGAPLYNASTKAWDVVVVELASPSSAGTIKIAGSDESALWAVGRRVVATGWGRTSYGGYFSDTLQAVTLTIQNASVCTSYYGPMDFARTTLCAGGAAGQGTCQGDSGGPLVAATGNGSHRLIGSTNFGPHGCGIAGIPGGYAHLAADPLRTALRNFVLSQTGLDIVGSGSAVTTPASPTPEDPLVVTIEVGPRKKLSGKGMPFGKGRAKRAYFLFKANAPAVTFRCHVDRVPFACGDTSTEIPGSYLAVTPEVRKGNHTFEVTAADAFGNISAPASYSWKRK